MDNSDIYQKVEFEYGGQIKNSQIQSKIEQMKAMKNGQLIKEQNNQNIKNQWNKIFPVGPGFSNLGNTCFLNSVLQALTYTPALANYLLSGDHQKDCKKTGKNASNFCTVCMFQDHVKKCFPKQQKAIQPLNIVRNMRYIFKRFRLGRQEDSHEFLRLMVESMQRGALPYNTKLDNSDPVSKIFNGKLKSQIKCLSCNYKSEIFENFLDLSLDLDQSKDLDRCLDQFFKVEQLGGKNKYKCSGCKKQVNAQKRFLINEYPNVLTCQLKRFTYTLQKINKHIKFPQVLNMQKYMCPEKKVQKLQYELYAVVVHAGGSIYSGHYYCYVKNSNGAWHCMDDSSVSQISFDKIMREQAYLLFYTKKTDVKQQTKEQNQESKLKPENLQNGEEIQKRKQSVDSSLVQNNEQKKKQSIDQTEGVSLGKEIGKIKQSEDYKKHMQDLDSMFVQNPIKQNGEQKVNKTEQTEQTQKKEQIEQEEDKQEYIEQEIIIPGDIRALKSLKRSKLKKRKMMKQFDQLFEKQKKLKVDENRQKISEIKEAMQSNALSSQKLDKKKKKITDFDTLDESQVKNSSVWDDVDQSEQERRKQLQESNQQFFEYKQKEKDEYDIEYDQGKAKKVKKKKTLPPQKLQLQFQQIFDEAQREKKHN